MLPSKEFPVHLVTDSLTDRSERKEYSAQDFWVYTGLRSAIPISYLRPIFERGGTPEHVDAARPLADAYWQWAKNQAFEKVYTLDGTLKSGPCTPETAAFATPFTLRYDNTDNTQGTLPPLTSEVVEVTIDTQLEVGTIHADNDGDSDDPRYKVYRDPAAPGCDTNEQDGARRVSVIQPDQKYFVLLSNVSMTDSYTFVVQVSQGVLPE